MIEIDTLKEEYIDPLVSVWVEFFDYHSQFDSRFQRREDAEQNFAKFLRELLDSDNDLVLVALYQGKPVGYSITRIKYYPPVFKTEKFGYLLDMAVSASHRRKGIGSMMMQQIETWLNSKGITRIELHVASANPIGNNFWRKSGFSEIMKKMSKEI